MIEQNNHTYDILAQILVND